MFECSKKFMRQLTNRTISIIQTFLMLVAIVSATWVGLLQNGINKKLYVHQISVAVNFEIKDNKVLIKNVGNSNVLLLKVSFQNGQGSIMWPPNGSLVMPNGTQTLFHYPWKENHKNYIAPNARFAFGFTVFLLDTNSKIYSLKAIAEIELDNEVELKESTVYIVEFIKVQRSALEENPMVGYFDF